MKHRSLFALATIIGALLLLAPLSASAQSKIGVFDSISILTESKAGQDAQREINVFRQERQKEISGKEKVLKEKENAFMNQVLSLSQERKEALSKDLERDKIEFGRYVKDSERELADRLEKLNKRLNGQLTGIVTTYGQQNGYSLILERSQVVYSDGTVDISAELTQAFDQKFAR